MAQVKQIGELDALEINELNSALLQSGYMVVENNNEANIVSIPDLITALGKHVEFGDLETASKEIINAINEINAFVYNYVWIGTRQEYEELESYEDMFYLVTDGGSGWDPVLDNTSGVGVVDLDTDVTNISAYKMYNANVVETVDAPNLYSIGRSTFNACYSLYSVRNNEAFKMHAYAFQSCNRLYKICPKNLNYVGAVTSIPFTEVTLAYNPHGNNLSYQTVSNYPFASGDLVFNEADSKVYEYDGSAWSVFIPEYGMAGGKECFSGSSNLAVLPYELRWIDTPTTALTWLTNSFDSCGHRNIYLDADNFTTHDRGSIATGMFKDASKLEKVWVVSGGSLSDDISLIFTSLAEAMFSGTTELKSMTFTNVTSISNTCFYASGIEKVIAPNVTSLPTGNVTGPFANCPNLTEIQLGAVTSMPRGFAGGSTALEKVTIGDGTAGLAFFSSMSNNAFNGCSSLWSLTLNTTTMATSSANLLSGFTGTPIANFLGTTTTAITEGSTTTTITIDGSSVSAINGNITTYGGKDWILTDGAWTEWGTNGNKHPVIKVPSSLITDYTADQYWSSFSEEIWTAI